MDIFLKILSGIILLFSLIPLVRHNHWSFRIFEFPRIQKWTINLIIAIAYIFFLDISSSLDWLFIFLLTVNFIYLSFQIFPYLVIAPKQIQTAKKQEKVTINLLIANVYQDNQQFEKLIDLVKEIKADIVLLVETNQVWKEKCLQGFGDKYNYQIIEERENTYGMMIFSKFKLENSEVRHLIKAEIPSITTDVILSNNRKIKFYALHPEPPVPKENPNSTDRDAEILMIGKEAAKEELPIIVAGDLNDVAWSYTSNLFQKISGLLDPRRGRGLFSSFHANYPLFRWPLDHIFCSGHFRVKKMKRLKSIGSDHFPILISLHLHAIEDDSEEFEVDHSDKVKAAEKIEAAK